MTKPRWLPVVLVGSLIAAGLFTAVPGVGAEPARKPYGVATESPGATREASRVLEAGGNAFDAAVVAALVAGFTNPSSSGIGGGGFALVWSARDKKATVLDFRESAPAGIDVTALDKRPLPLEKRGQSVGVPGEVAGLFELHGRYGQLPWKDLVMRASRLAELGFVAEPHTTSQVAEQAQGPLAQSSTFRAVYLPGGKPLTLGQKLRASKLAKTLARIAGQGKRGFYEGPVASDMARAAGSAGGALSLADLSAYRTVEREPLRITWGGKQVLTMPLPSAGGLLIAQTLGLFSAEELRALNDAPAKRVHLLAEAMRASFADRARYVGDPAFVGVDVGKLLSPPRLAARKARLAEDRTHTQPRFGLEEAGTHHLITADADGNWVTLTTTVNDAFGARLVAEESGVILNNELNDFSSPDSVAPFGLSENPNQVRAGARPVSSMSPTLVLEGGVPTQALGGSGGITIGPNVAQVLLNRLAYGMSVTDSVAAPRFTIPPPRSGLTLVLETALGQAHAADLQARGELVSSRDWKNAVQLVARENGAFSAAADPRKGGTAAAQ
ncbi:MAG: gamma-glutamyltransferase [Myxococcales bacterium]|nr:MAG: gamma-glutamyltransferase [Myxococcales bacterium]